MEAPNNRNQSGDRPACFDVSPERLDAMDPAALEQAMEDALSLMTDETYDPAVIDAYLDALDRRAPMPDGPDAAASYAAFTQRVASLPEEQKTGAEQITLIRSNPPIRRKRRLTRLLVAAALSVACLFGTAVVAQAAGFDVLHAVARWTEDAFSFGTLPGEVRPEFQEAKAAFTARGLPFRCIGVPEGFEVCETSVYLFPVTDYVRFDVSCEKENSFVGFSATQTDGTSSTIYEKDDNDVKILERNGVVYYTFHNVNNYTAAWMQDNIEYCITTTGSYEELTALIQSVYEE